MEYSEGPLYEFFIDENYPTNLIIDTCWWDIAHGMVRVSFHYHMTTDDSSSEERMFTGDKVLNLNYYPFWYRRYILKKILDGHN